MGQQEKNEITHKSDRLLDALYRLRAAEQLLRHQKISSDEFQRAVDQVEVLRQELAALGGDGRNRESAWTRTGDTNEDAEEEKSA